MGPAKDYAFLDRHVADGWRYTDFNGVVRGKDEYYKVVDNIISYTQELSKFDVRLVGEDLAIASAVYRALAELKSGAKGDNTIALTSLWQLQDGVWKALLHHTTWVIEPGDGWPR